LIQPNPGESVPVRKLPKWPSVKPGMAGRPRPRLFQEAVQCVSFSLSRCLTSSTSDPWDDRYHRPRILITVLNCSKLNQFLSCSFSIANPGSQASTSRSPYARRLAATYRTDASRSSLSLLSPLRRSRITSFPLAATTRQLYALSHPLFFLCLQSLGHLFVYESCVCLCPRTRSPLNAFPPNILYSSFISHYVWNVTRCS